MSIHPSHADAILRGEKRVEFRKVRLREDVEHVAIYATAPTKRIVGFFRVRHVRSSGLSTVWRRYREVGGVSRRFFYAYYDGRDQAVAIEIDYVTPLKSPIPLDRLRGLIAAPQSFAYLHEQAVEEACPDDWERHRRTIASGA